MPLGFEKLSLKGDKKAEPPTEKSGNVPSPSPNEGPSTPPASPPKDAPPSYAANDPISEPTPTELNAAFASLNLPDVPPAFPTADHCLAHLKLLNVFHALKEDIGYTDGLFGLWDARCEHLQNKERDEALARTREKRWALYIARAVERFEDWWLKVLWEREGNTRLEGKQMTASVLKFAEFTKRGQVQKWKVTALPPVGELSIVLSERMFTD